MSTYDANSKDSLVTYKISNALWLNMIFIQRVLSFVSQSTRGIFQSGECNIRTSQIPHLSITSLCVI